MWLPRLLLLLLINKPDCISNTFDIINLRKIAWGGDRHTDTQTDRQTDIATYRLNRPRGPSSENLSFTALTSVLTHHCTASSSHKGL